MPPARPVREFPPALASTRIEDDPEFEDFVQHLENERDLLIEQALRINEADVAHLKAGGNPNALPSGRRMSPI